MDRNISADQVFDLLSGMAKVGIDMASESRREESPDMDSLFDTPVGNNRRPQRSTPTCDPTSRRNDVGYASEPYQAGPNRGYNNRPQNTNPYSYGYGYASDPVPYSNRSQQRSTPAYRNGGYAPQQQTRRVNNAVNYSTNGGTSSASYGMGGGYSSQSQYQSQPQPQQNPYRSEYDERNYAFPDDGFSYGGGYR